MAEAYDPDRPRTWPEDQRLADQRVWLAVIDGDLQPLMEFLRSPLPITRDLREHLARHIEGKDTLRKIITKKSGAASWGKASRSGSWGVRKAIARERDMTAFGQIVDALTAEDAGKDAAAPIAVDAAVATARELFGFSRAKAYAELARYAAIRDGRAHGLTFFAGGCHSTDSRE